MLKSDVKCSTFAPSVKKVIQQKEKRNIFKKRKKKNLIEPIPNQINSSSACFLLRIEKEKKKFFLINVKTINHSKILGRLDTIIKLRNRRRDQTWIDLDRRIERPALAGLASVDPSFRNRSRDHSVENVTVVEGTFTDLSRDDLVWLRSSRSSNLWWCICILLKQDIYFFPLPCLSYF